MSEMLQPRLDLQPSSLANQKFVFHLWWWNTSVTRPSHLLSSSPLSVLRCVSHPISPSIAHIPPRFLSFPTFIVPPVCCYTESATSTRIAAVWPIDRWAPAIKWGKEERRKRNWRTERLLPCWMPCRWRNDAFGSSPTGPDTSPALPAFPRPVVCRFHLQGQKERERDMIWCNNTTHN